MMRDMQQLLMNIRRTLVSVFAPTRVWDWWEFKVPVFLGVAYLMATAGGIRFEILWPRLIVIIAAIVPVASYVCVINEITDRREDRIAGKRNCMIGRSSLYQTLWVVVCLVGGGFAFASLHRSPMASWLYIANWLAFTVYSVPPLRLKRCGVWGVVADACGGQVLPTLWSAAFVVHDADRIPSVGLWMALCTWAFALGCRGIVRHQLRDLDADLAAGVGTLAARIGANHTSLVLRRVLLPAEVVAFSATASLAGAWPALIAFTAFGTISWIRQRGGERSSMPIDEGSLVVPYYPTLFPLVGAFQLATRAPAALALLPLHISVFPGAWGLSLGRLVSRYGGSQGRPEAADTTPPPDGSVSVVIPAYQGRRTIAACLDSLSGQAGVGRLEVIMVESSGDGTADIVARDFPAVKVVREPGRLSAGAARNRGATLAAGQFILFLDQDCVAPHDWVARIVNHLRQPGIDAVGGSIGIANPWVLSGAAVYFIEFLHQFPQRGPVARDPLFLLGCNAGYRAEVLAAVQFPDRTLAEDVLFTERVRAAGFSVVYAPEITVLHHNREGWGEFFAYARKMGRAAAEYHAELGRPWMRPFLRWPMLVFPAALAVSPMIGLRLIRSPWRYLFLFILVAPACVLGNLVWAAAFHRRIMEIR